MAGISLTIYLLAYHTYGRFLGKTIFGLRADRPTPAHRLRDEVDFVPTRRQVLFGHHFTSIAGTGPIVGPAIGVIWGWAPAFLWVVLGPILIGALHDLGALAVSIRHDGRSIAEVIGKTVSPRVRRIFFVLVFFELWIVIAIFALIIALLFQMYPQAVLAVWLEIPIAIWVGRRMQKTGANLLLLSLVGVALMYLAVWAGSLWPVAMPEVLGQSPVLIWMLLLFIYAAAASLLPVDRLLQPRDYLNSHQLLIAMGLLAAGLLVARPEVVAPAFRAHPPGAPALWPFLFVIIACGAVSGFHALVSSGTSAKQLDKESDALFVGFGSMLFEGGLAVLVLIACTAGLGLGTLREGALLVGPAAYADHYGSWAAASGLGAKLGAFIEGAANMIAVLGIGRSLAVAIMGVFIVSFAATTLDTAARIQRYAIGELTRNTRASALSGRWPATLAAVGTAMALAFYSGDGKGAMALWPIFGAVNQLLASLALLAVTAYLVRRGKPVWVTLPAMSFMLLVTLWAMASNLTLLWGQGRFFLAGLSGFLLVLPAWMLIETWFVLRAEHRFLPASRPRGPVVAKERENPEVKAVRCDNHGKHHRPDLWQQKKAGGGDGDPARHR